MPYWAVVIIIVVIVVAYYLLSAAGRERRREAVTADFGRMPDFHANQVYRDVRGESAIGLDDRGRRMAIARKHARPRTKIYSFSHIESAEMLQNDKVIGKTGKGSAGRPPTDGGAEDGGDGSPAGSLFGSTARGIGGAPVIRPVLGRFSKLAVRITFEDTADTGVVIRFYEGRPINTDSVAAEKALGEARMCLAALDVAVKRAGLPPRPAISGRGLGPRV